jgi:hypothetical protein
MKAFKYILFPAGIVFAFGINACRKDVNTPQTIPAAASGPDTSLLAAKTDIIAESYFDDLALIGDEASEYALNSYRSSDPHVNPFCACGGLFFDTLNHSDNDSVIVNMGLTNCLNTDGRYRRGTLTYIYSGNKHYRDSLNFINVKIDNYFVDNHSISGTLLITCLGHINGCMTWKMDVRGTIVLANNGGKVTYNGTRMRRLIAGEGHNVVNWGMAKIGITGSGSGQCADGTYYSSVITNEIVRDITCIGYYRFISQGKVDYIPAGRSARHLDFGNDVCDDQATITLGASTWLFTMI